MKISKSDKKFLKSINFPYSQVNAIHKGTNWSKMKLYDKHKDIYYEVENKIRYLKTENSCKYILSYDSETYKGYCKLLARDNDYILNPTFSECLDFLFHKASKPNGYRFFYNIDFDVSAILKLWYNGLSEIKQLKNGIEVKFREYTLYWLKGKFFTIRKNRNVVRFVDLFNFFKIGLNIASKKYLKDIEKDKIDGNLLNTDISYWNKNQDIIIKYCIKDCKITSKLAKILIDSLLKAKISLPKLLVSSGSLAKQDFRFNCRINNLKNIPKKIIQIAYDVYLGGKFEIQKKGFFEMAYLYDINSQYPNFIKELYDLHYGYWKKIDYLPKKECFGYFKVDLKINPNVELSTIAIKLNTNKILTVCGIIKNLYFTWYDLDLMREYITKIHKAYIFIPTVKENEVSKDKLKYIKPFKERIQYHYKLKTSYKNNNDIMYNVHKITMNALYGSFIERHENIDKDDNKTYSVGILFNPIYASQITAFGRWSVIKDIPRNYWKYIIAIHTDSIMITKPLDKYLTLDNKIGNWNLEAKGMTIILNTGMYQISYLVKSRGIPKKYIKTWLRFCLKYSDLNQVEFEKYHMRKLSEALVRDKSLINVNTMTIIKKTVKLNSDSKRHWKSDFYDFKDVLSRNINSYLWYTVYKNSEIFNIEHLYQNPLLVD